VTGVVYRQPGLLAKAVTTLDVLSGAGHARHRRRLERGGGARPGLYFPPIKERFELLEDALRICLQMWSGDDGPFTGTHVKAERTLNSPQALSRPHPPILIGGAGERKTLRLVARYAQACNLFPARAGPQAGRAREHCEHEGRDYDEIEKTVGYTFDVGAKASGSARS